MEYRSFTDLVDNVCLWIVVWNRAQKRKLILRNHLVHIGGHQWMHDDNKHRRSYVCRECGIPFLGNWRNSSGSLELLTGLPIRGVEEAGLRAEGVGEF